MNDSHRYIRQTALPEIGKAGQINISRSRVLVIGAGGLGCPALLYLAAAGIGTLGIVDHDIVDITNLQRQVLFNSDQCGILKVESAKKHLSALNPEIKINVYPVRLESKNALAIAQGYDIIIDGTDNFESKFLINDVAVKLEKPVIYGSISGFEGQVSVFFSSIGPCYRCLYPGPPVAYVPDCAQAGVLGALAGIIGSVQAMEAIKIAAQNKALEPLIGKLWITDSRTMNTSIIKIPKNSNCPVCSMDRSEIVIEDIIAAAEIYSEQARALLKDAVFVDVRENEEWSKGHIENALHLPLSSLLKSRELDIDKDKLCIVYCQIGQRGKKAGAHLINMGFKNVRNLKGGYLAWCEEA